MRLSRHAALSLCLTVGTVLCAGAAGAQTASAPPDPQALRRTLYGHTFIPSELVGSPFVPSSVGSQVGFGYASVTAPSGNGGSTTSQLGALALGFDAQIGITDWWAIRAAARGVALTGLTGESVLEAGALVAYDARVGTTFSWAYRDRVRMGITLDAQYRPDYTINVRAGIDEFRRLVDQAIDRARMTGNLMLPSPTDINLSRVLSNSQKLQFGGGWQAAVALHRFIGLFFDFRYAHVFERAGDDKTTSGEFTAGAAVSMDFNAISPLPFGILGAYRVAVPAESQPALTHDVSAGFFYTGRRSLLLGGEAAMNFSPVGPGVRLFVVEAQLLMRYFW